MDQPLFRDRREAGRVLAVALLAYRGDPNVVVLGLVRGGVPVAFEVATALRAPLEVFVVRKLGAPSDRELAMGAIASGGVLVLNEDVIEFYGISPSLINLVASQEQRELDRQERTYRGDALQRDFSGRIAIVVEAPYCLSQTVTNVVG